MPLSLAISG